MNIKDVNWHRNLPESDATKVFLDREPEAYTFANLLDSRPNVSIKPEPEWKIWLSSALFTACIAVLIVWGWFAWMEAHNIVH
jgi:hypothetical protein